MPREDLEIYRRAGFGGRSGISQSPALLIIDVTYGFTGHRGMSVAEAVESYPNACVPAAWPAVDANVRLLGAARAAGIPTFVQISSANLSPMPWMYCRAITTRLFVGILTPAIRATSALLHAGSAYLGAVFVTTRDRFRPLTHLEEPNPARSSLRLARF